MTVRGISRLATGTLIVLLFSGCAGVSTESGEVVGMTPMLVDDAVVCEDQAAPSVHLAKWPGNRSAAVSVNYDTGSLEGRTNTQVRAVVDALGFRIDYELISGNVSDDKAAFIRDYLLPNGYDLFGHGREHENHDIKGPAWSLESAEHTHAMLDQLGVRPVAFAYPEGAGRDPAVQQAIAEAGFLSGRLFDGADPFIAPGDETAPVNWFALPSLRMESINFEGSGFLINGTADLVPFLDENVRRRSWLIMTYHSIGRPEGWGFYDLSAFETDMQAIAERDLWVASLNDATLYLHEYETAELDVQTSFSPDARCEVWVDISVEDRRDDTRFNLPLSIVISAPQDWHGQSGAITCPGHDAISIEFSEQPAVVDLQPDGVACRLEYSL